MKAMRLNRLAYAIAFLGLILLTGCDEESKSNVAVKQPIAQEGPPPLVVTVLNNSALGVSGRWNQIEFSYKGKVYVYLQNYDGNNQAIVPVTVIDTSAK
jgi:hypothetical protein